MPSDSSSKANFTSAWVVIAMLCVMQIFYIVLCYQIPEQLQHMRLAEEQRVFIRSILYVLAIITFPITSLIRHIQLRLNQTMTGDKPAHKRYLLTVIVSQVLISWVGVFGLVMFALGDNFNTLYIFSFLAVLGFFLQRPKIEEYQSIVAALNK